MSKAVINNEIIILRKFVEQARVHIIKKLTRDATKYRNKKGTDAQKAKNERKSKRLAAEILSIKKVKKDDITKDILTNNLNLKEVLENQHSLPINRAIARIAHHKIFSKKIVEFKNKYPNFMEFMVPGRKKKAICEWKEKKKIKKEKTAEKMIETENMEGPIDLGNCEDKLKWITQDSLTNDRENNEECNKTRSVKIAKLDERKKVDDKSDKYYLKDSGLKKKSSTPKIINKQATVKKLTDILQEDISSKDCEKEVDNESQNLNIVVKKEVDSFFMTGDEKSYLSIAAAKDKVSNWEDDLNYNEKGNYKKNKFSKEENEKFFSKVIKYKKSDGNFLSQGEDKRSYKKGNNGKKWKQEKESKFDSTSYRSNGEKGKLLDYKKIERLHPSWEAKKKEQEMLKKGFKGKKIIFSEEA